MGNSALQIGTWAQLRPRSVAAERPNKEKAWFMKEVW